MRKPCNHCPFRKTAANGWLGKERSTEIVNQVQRADGVFHCHKTVDYSQSMSGKVTDKSRLCAGSVALHKKEGRPNFIYRLIDHTISGESLVVDSSEAFIEKHTENAVLVFLGLAKPVEHA